MLSALRYFRVAVGFVRMFFQIVRWWNAWRLGRCWNLCVGFLLFLYGAVRLHSDAALTYCRFFAILSHDDLLFHFMKPNPQHADLNKQTALAFAVLEEFDLTQPLFRGGLRFIWTTKVLLPVLGNDLVTLFHFLDHDSSSTSDFA
jgi:hypothetical protein